MPTPTTVAELRERMRELQSSEPLGTLQATRADLARLLPGGGLTAGAVYRVLGSSSLAAVAMAEASASGSWCAFVGWPHLGAEALAALGIALDRCVLVPHPGERWMSVVSTLADAMPFVALRPPASARPAEADAARLAARLRERGCTLLVAGNWPAVQATITLQRATFVGLDAGHGLLRGQAAEVLVRDRAGRERSGWLRLGGTASTDELAAARWAERASESVAESAADWRAVPAPERWAVGA